jgi:hypothetical protein
LIDQNFKEEVRPRPMKRIELVGRVDEHHRLCVDVPKTIQPGPVRVIVEAIAKEEKAGKDTWGAAVAQAWIADWSDSREDIYSLE